MLEVLSHIGVLDPIEAAACDVDGNGRLDRRDAEQILDFVIGARDRFDAATTCASDWLFVPQHESPLGPLATARGACPSPPTLVELRGEPARTDFAALLFGDCDASWRHGLESSTVHLGGDVEIVVGRMRRTRANRMRLAITVRFTRPVSAAQLELPFDTAALRPTRIRSLRQRTRVLARAHADDTGKLIIVIAGARPFSPAQPLELLLELTRPER